MTERWTCAPTTIPIRSRPPPRSPGRTWADSARCVEDLGCSTLTVPDHFDEGLGPITALATAAAVTSSLRLGTLVLDCDFRHPAVLARELATLDQLSDGRLEVGLGAGWKATDYSATGIAMDPPGERVDRMIEYVQVLRGLFSDAPFAFAGKHYSIDGLTGTPAPHQSEGRSCSSAAVVGCSPTPAPMPTSWGSTRKCAPATGTPIPRWIR